MGQQISGTSDGIEFTVTDESGNSYTIGFHVPENGRLDVYSNNDGSFDLVETDENGQKTVGRMEPLRGDKSTDPLYGPMDLSMVTDPADNITAESAVLYGELQVLQNYNDAEVTFEWGETGEGLPQSDSIGSIDRTGRFATKIDQLSPETEYEFVVSGDNKDPLTFTTLSPYVSVETETANSSTTDATLVGNISEISGYDSVDVYFEWGKAGGGLSDQNQTSIETFNSVQEVTTTISDLNPATEYEYRIVAQTDDGIVEGSVMTFETGE